MATDLAAALIEYSRGIEDRSGTSALDIAVARLRQGEGANPLMVDAAVRKAAGAKVTDSSRLWEGIGYLLRKLQIRSNSLSVFIEQALSNQALGGETRYHILTSLSVAAGGLAPAQIENQLVLKRELPGLWLDLATEAYRNDTAGLTDAISSTMRQATPLAWTDLRKRIPKLREAFGHEFNAAAKRVGQLLPSSEARQGWLQAIDTRYGTKLAQAQETQRTEKIGDWGRPRIARAIAPLQRFQFPHRELMYGT